MRATQATALHLQIRIGSQLVGTLVAIGVGDVPRSFMPVRLPVRNWTNAVEALHLGKRDIIWTLHPTRLGPFRQLQPTCSIARSVTLPIVAIARAQGHRCANGSTSLIPVLISNKGNSRAKQARWKVCDRAHVKNVPLHAHVHQDKHRVVSFRDHNGVCLSVQARSFPYYRYRGCIHTFRRTFPFAKFGMPLPEYVSTSMTLLIATSLG